MSAVPWRALAAALLLSCAPRVAPVPPGSIGPSPLIGDAGVADEPGGSDATDDAVADDEDRHTCDWALEESYALGLRRRTMQAIFSGIDDLEGACHGLGYESMTAIAVDAPTDVIVPSRLGGIPIYRLPSVDAARHLAVTPAISDFVRIAVEDNELVCSWERLVVTGDGDPGGGSRSGGGSRWWVIATVAGDICLEHPR
jgi:hypothetical protein